MDLEFGIRETTCRRDSGEDPAGCDFQRGYYVVSEAGNTISQRLAGWSTSLLPWPGAVPSRKESVAPAGIRPHWKAPAVSILYSPGQGQCGSVVENLGSGVRGLEWSWQITEALLPQLPASWNGWFQAVNTKRPTPKANSRDVSNSSLNDSKTPAVFLAWVALFCNCPSCIIWLPPPLWLRLHGVRTTVCSVWCPQWPERGPILS